MLQRSAEEFEAALALEARENPALEIEERGRCPHCGRGLRLGYCSSCDGLALDGFGHNGRAASTASTWEAFESGQAGERRGAALETQAGAGEPLAIHVWRQLRTALAREDYAIAAYLAGSLDERGLLATSAAEVAAALAVEDARVEHAIAVLQTLDPPGVGARSMVECLLRQLAIFEEQGSAPEFTRPMIEHWLPDLAARRFTTIARALGVSVAEAKAGWSFIRANLSPYPAGAFDADAVIPLWPDVVFRRTETGYEAEVIERRRYRLSVQPLYSELSVAFSGARAPGVGQSHVQAYVARTHEFLALVQRRWHTLVQITTALADYQGDFLEHGEVGLRPLTRSELARLLGISESTVSRATAGKFALLPSGQIVSFEVFFDASVAVKRRLLALVAAEDGARPLRDEELARMLASQGVRLAPRTVAKYREALGIAPYRLRAAIH
jgi:RNA polymerase sigma-54 factor